MGARQKLNQVHLLSTMGIATIVAVLAESWTAFFVAVAVLVGVSIYAGDLRFDWCRGK